MEVGLYTGRCQRSLRSCTGALWERGGHLSDRTLINRSCSKQNLSSVVQTSNKWPSDSPGSSSLPLHLASPGARVGPQASRRGLRALEYFWLWILLTSDEPTSPESSLRSPSSCDWWKQPEVANVFQQARILLQVPAFPHTSTYLRLKRMTQTFPQISHDTARIISDRVSAPT